MAKISSLYRALGEPEKAIDLFYDAVDEFGGAIYSIPLCTSIAAAYCDISDYEQAEDTAKLAYAMSKGRPSRELSAVFGRIQKEKATKSKECTSEKNFELPDEDDDEMFLPF